ncbi:hypothetical protein [Devosia sp. 1566]|uniref:hypothetical protein n=1 Tax=Devosia sp. 1566 TaxID=2499144 RepID=UPI000FDB14F0|nr:hypothetical protein [Devosia sp. 1566]
MSNHVSRDFRPVSAFRGIPSLLWLLACAWCAYWTWHLVWWTIPAPHGLVLFTAGFVVSPFAVLFIATAYEWWRRLESRHSTRKAMHLHCAVMIVGSVLLFTFGGNPKPGSLEDIRSYGFLLAFYTLLDLPILLLLWIERRAGRHGPGWVRLTCLAVAVPGIVALLFVWSAANIGLVAWKAKSTAGTDPYCLQVHGDPYKVVNAWADLSGLRMTTPETVRGGVTSDDYIRAVFHAVLVVRTAEGNKAYNWSYRAQDFLSLPIGPSLGRTLGPSRVTIACTPVHDYLGKLGSHVPASPPLDYFPPLNFPARPHRVLPPLPEGEPFLPPVPAGKEFWHGIMVRYLSLEALLEACEIEVTREALEEVRALAEKARVMTGYTEDQGLRAYRGILFSTGLLGDYACRTEAGSRRELMQYLPHSGLRPKSTR